MATLSTTFDDAPTFTEQWDVGRGSFSITNSGVPSDTLSGWAMSVTIGGGSNFQRYVATWDQAGSIDGDVQLLVRWLVTSANDDIGFHARCFICVGGAADDEDAYYAGHTVNGDSRNQTLQRYVGAASTTMQQAAKTLSTNTWYYTRIEKTGTTIRSRTWADGDSEPGDWDLSVTDANLSGGNVGVGQFETDVNTLWVSYMAVGTGGDNAPMPGGGGSVEVEKNVAATAALQATDSLNVTATAALQSTTAKQVTAQAALQATPTLNVPATAALMATLERAVGAEAALLAVEALNVGALATLLAEIERSVGADAALLAAVARTVTADAALLAEISKNVTAAAALGMVLALAVEADAALSATVARNVAATAALSAEGTFELSVPSLAALRATESQAVAALAALLSSSSLPVTATAAFSEAFTKQVTAQAALRATARRSVPALGRFSGVAARTVEALAALGEPAPSESGSGSFSVSLAGGGAFEVTLAGRGAFEVRRGGRGAFEVSRRR